VPFIGLMAASLGLPASLGVLRRSAARQQRSHSGRRRAHARAVRNIDNALADGYKHGGCVSGPEEGAMGVHYVNPALFDDRLEVEHPEALVYEPRHGRLQLVAVEYITPAAAWQASHDVGVQPDLKGHLFHFAPGPNRYGPDAFYELHVWAWEPSPSGIFADWNPRVSCAEHTVDH
jgi:hypothetical protein